MMADATQRRIWFERRAFQFFTRYIFFRTTEKRDSIRSIDAKLLAEFVTDTPTVDSFLRWIAQLGFSPDGGHSANPNDYRDRL